MATSILSLYHGDHKVGEGRIKTQPGKFSIAGEGLCVGRDGGEAVTDDYPGALPWTFTGGPIKRVAGDMRGDLYVDLEREAVAMMSRVTRHHGELRVARTPPGTAKVQILLSSTSSALGW